MKKFTSTKRFKVRQQRILFKVNSDTKFNDEYSIFPDPFGHFNMGAIWRSFEPNRRRDKHLGWGLPTRNGGARRAAQRPASRREKGSFSLLFANQESLTFCLFQVALIAIAGEFRKGKSFLLNFFTRYLRHLRDGAKGDWLDPAVPLASDFGWKRGTKRYGREG